MARTTDSYVGALLDFGVKASELAEMKNIIALSEELDKVLNSPAVPAGEKEKVIKDVFPAGVRKFANILAEENDFDKLDSIIEKYTDVVNKRSGVAKATVFCVEEPDEQQKKKLEEFVCKKENASDAVIKYVKDESLVGGFIIRIGNKEYDRSLKSKLNEIKKELAKNVKNIESAEKTQIVAALKKNVRDYEFQLSNEEIGTVVSVGDGIVRIYGINHAMYGEIVVCENGVKGMVQDIKRDSVGAILFGSEDEIEEGTKVKRTHKMAGVPVGEGFIGRIVNSLGEPIDGKGPVKESGYRPVENSAPSIVERKSVDTPLETGILSIDSMFPIGRGQRELIIGDRQTGKTSIALDAIINQKGKDVICIYNAIGQKASSVAKLVNVLEKSGALEYTIVVCSTASEPSSLQYISPYSATAMAEYFMHKGKNCLIVYDDLSKHAVAYRALSLLLERSPGREAYPGDVFYLHSRLLERSSRLCDELGGGSITALPIVETQAGDVSAYIPTNVISITDGQIFLESDLFFSGMRPAINVGLSVSRVGGAAQTKAMKKAAGTLRIDLAQYRETAVFTQFSSDLDNETKESLAYGKTLMELLKQPLASPLSLSQMVIILTAATAKKLNDIDPDKIKDFQNKFTGFIEERYSHIVSAIVGEKDLADETKQAIYSACDEFKKVYNG